MSFGDNAMYGIGHSIANAGHRLHFQAQLKYAELKKLTAADEFHSREVWCDLPSIAPVCKCGQALIYNEWVAWHKYIVECSTKSSNCWEVVLKDPQWKLASSIPKFHRICQVA